MTGVSAACTDLLAQARRFSPEYGDGLANHLPMALIALDRMGADAATMQRFFARYSRRLEPAGDASGPADPLQLLGTGAGLAAYCEREDFTLLHIVTACHAYRLVQPYVGDSKAAVRHLWRAVVVAWLTTDPADAGQAEDVGAIQIDAGTLRMLCCAAADDHTIKLGYSALCEYRDSGDARYLQAAYRKAAPKTAVTP
jgi:hypothetical protein